METNAHNPFVRALETGGPWVADLLCALDSNSRTALAQSSKAGLSALLQEWTENASLTVWVKGSAARAEEPASKLAARMRTASMQLLTRGRLPTEVSIAQLKGHEFSEGDAWWVDTLPELAWEGHYLHLQLTHIPRGLLMCASQAFHHLTTLSLGIPDDEIYTLDLPHPSTLPRLKTLHITGAITGTAEEETSMWDSVAPYIHQLTSLTVSEQWSMSDTPPPDPVRALWSVSSFWTGSPGLPLWATILHPNHPTHTLTHLDVHEELQPWLVQLLLLGAPELKELVCLSPEEWPYDTEMQGQCSWTRLGLRKWEGHVSLDVLACLPATADTLTIDLLSDDFGVKAYVAVTDEVSDLLRRVQIHGCTKVFLNGLCDAEPAADIPAAITAISAALSPPTHPQYVPPSDMEVELNDNFIMCPALVHGINALYAAGWHKLSLEIHEWPTVDTTTTRLPPLQKLTIWPYEHDPFTDARLAELTECVSSVDTLRVLSSVELETPVPAGTVLPFRRLFDHDCVELAAWCEQAELLGPGVEWEVDTLDVSLTPEQVESGEAERMAVQLRGVRLTSVVRLKMPKPEWCSDEDEQRVLQAHLAIAQQLPGRADLQTWIELSDSKR